MSLGCNSTGSQQLIGILTVTVTVLLNHVLDSRRELGRWDLHQRPTHAPIEKKPLTNGHPAPICTNHQALRNHAAQGFEDIRRHGLGLFRPKCFDETTNGIADIGNVNGGHDQVPGHRCFDGGTDAFPVSNFPNENHVRIPAHGFDIAEIPFPQVAGHLRLANARMVVEKLDGRFSGNYLMIHQLRTFFKSMPDHRCQRGRFPRARGAGDQDNPVGEPNPLNEFFRDSQRPPVGQYGRDVAQADLHPARIVAACARQLAKDGIEPKPQPFIVAHGDRQNGVNTSALVVELPFPGLVGKAAIDQRQYIGFVRFSTKGIPLSVDLHHWWMPGLKIDIGQVAMFCHKIPEKLMGTLPRPELGKGEIQFAIMQGSLPGQNTPMPSALKSRWPGNSALRDANGHLLRLTIHMLRAFDPQVRHSHHRAADLMLQQ
jgi:hypothetical protein